MTPTQSPEDGHIYYILLIRIAHTHTSTRFDHHTRGLATNRHRSLVERGGRKVFVRDKGLATFRFPHIFFFEKKV